MRRILPALLALCLLPGLALAAKLSGKSPAKAAVAAAANPSVQTSVQTSVHASAQAGPQLVCPESVGLGEPFLVRLRTAKPLKSAKLTWLARTAQLSGRAVAGGWEAVALLGSDVGNSAPGRHELVVRVGGKGGGVLRKSVLVLPVERPVESLTLDEAMVTPPREAHARILAERQLIQGLMLDSLARPDRVGRTGQGGRMWSLPLLRPVPGAVSSIYGLGRILNGQPHAPHRGLDLEADTGQPVLAAADGLVLFSGALYYAGNAVYLDHGQGLVSAYFHQSELKVRQGQRVARGQLLGLAGDTGRSTRSHLHFGLWAWGRYVDPEPLFLYDALP